MIVQADKKYQLADWRVRPLSDELMLYARSDTHYLLYIYDRLKVCNLFQATKDYTNVINLSRLITLWYEDIEAGIRCSALTMHQSVHACMLLLRILA